MEASPMSSSPDSTSRPPIALSRVTERTRRQLYEAVAEVFFDRGENSRTYSPDEAGLAVHYFAGRWFAIWEDLDADAVLPEEVRRQIVRIRRKPEGEKSPGSYGLVFDEA
jgi:hypothetical protein